MNPFCTEMALIMSTDINPSPGFLRVRACSLIAWFFFLYHFDPSSLSASCSCLLLPFLNRFCLTCTFFADCNEVEQEWRGDHDSHTWDNHWGCSILPTHCNSTCHDQPGAFLSILIHLFHAYYQPFTNLEYLFVPFTRWHQVTKHQRHGRKPSASQDPSMQHLRSICSYRQRGRLDWAVHGGNWTWKISEKGCLLWARKFEFISILTGRMVLIILFFFSRPRDTWQAASMQTCAGCWRSNTKVTPQPNLTLPVYKSSKFGKLLRTHIKVQDLERLLIDCDSEEKIHENADMLSGGQKRKLQLGIGLLGGSKGIWFNIWERVKHG